jgi:predicted lipoprotein
MNRKISRTLAVTIGLVAAFVVVALLFGFTVVSTEEEAALTVEFDPAAYVDENWDAVQASIKDNAVPLADVLNQITPNAEGKAATEALTPVAEELGLITTGEAHVYRVNATGTVTDVVTDTSKGTIGVAIDGYDGPIEVRVYVGTRIPSDVSSIRDATGFIEFGDFREQTEYGKHHQGFTRRYLASGQGPLAGTLDMQVDVTVGVIVDRATGRTHQEHTTDKNEQHPAIGRTLSGYRERPQRRPQQQVAADRLVEADQPRVEAQFLAGYGRQRRNLRGWRFH